MRRLADLARQRIVQWMEADPRITQVTIAKAVGVSQSWVSQYKSGDVDADLDQLDAIAQVFGHTLHDLVDLKPSINEGNLLGAFRQVPPERRAFVIEVVRQLAGSYQQKRARSR